MNRALMIVTVDIGCRVCKGTGLLPRQSSYGTDGNYTVQTIIGFCLCVQAANKLTKEKK